MGDDIRRALEEARKQPGFLDRIAERIKEDVAILDALAASDPAPLTEELAWMEQRQHLWAFQAQRLIADLRASRAEVERLREQLRAMTDHAPLTDEALDSMKGWALVALTREGEWSRRYAEVVPQLIAEVERLRGEVERLQQLGPWPPTIATRWSEGIAERDRLRSELERLRDK